MAWIESHQELGAHPKTLKLARLLGITKVQAVGHLQYLWWWATDYAQDGDLSRYESLDIAIAGEWEGDADQFIDALARSGFLEQCDDLLVIHDWDEYAGRLIERRAKNAQRMREARAAQNPTQNEPCDERAAHVQSTIDARARLPNQTIPNQTEQDLTKGEPLAPDKPTLAKKPPGKSKKDLPSNGPAQHLVKVWSELSGVEPSNYRKAVGIAQSLVNAGVTEGELRGLYEYMASSWFWIEKGFDFGKAASQLDTYRTKNKTPERIIGNNGQRSDYFVAVAKGEIEP